MDSHNDDRYLVFVRADAAHDSLPEAHELPLAVCHSYEEARRVKLDAGMDCVIRFTGQTGGGD